MHELGNGAILLNMMTHNVKLYHVASWYLTKFNILWQYIR